MKCPLNYKAMQHSRMLSVAWLESRVTSTLHNCILGRHFITFLFRILLLNTSVECFCLSRNIGYRTHIFNFFKQKNRTGSKYSKIILFNLENRSTAGEPRNGHCFCLQVWMTCVWDISILKILFLMIKIKNVQADLTDVSAKTKELVMDGDLLSM